MKTPTRIWKWIQFLLGAGGLALLFWMIHKIGFRILKENLLHFGISSTLLLIFLYSVAQFCFCGAWYVLLKATHPDLSFWDLFRAYAAGDALNMTVPSANLAGEPVKVMMIRDKVSMESALSSVTIYKYSDILSMTLFLLAGWLIHFHYYSLPLAWNIGAGIVVGGMALLCFFLHWLQSKGIYHPTGKWLQKMGVEWIIQRLESAHLIDRAILDFYENHTPKLILSIFLNFLAWFGGVIEIVIFMALSKSTVSFSAALTIETFSLFINNVIFFVPARLGVGEGGRVLLFLTLGYPASAGMSYGIIRRIRELTWIALGMAFLLFRRQTKSEKIPSPSTNRGNFAPK